MNKNALRKLLKKEGYSEKGDLRDFEVV